jgi:hypothetical protein
MSFLQALQQLDRGAISVQRSDIHILLASANAQSVASLSDPRIHQRADVLVPALGSQP